MKPERWQQIERLYNSALELKSGQREGFLKEACAGNESLRKEVERLLARQPEAEGFMESPALEVAAKALAMTQAEEPRPNFVGRSLLHYRLVEKIGEGGMGVVYRAQDERLGRDVALKVLPAGTVGDEGARKHFRKEARTLSQLNHPNIAIVHDFDTQDGTDFLVMEYVAGTSLAAKLTGGPLPEKEVVALGLQIAEALEEAHAHGVVHRDLKPGNIMVTPKGRAKVLDFGLAKLLCPASETAATETLAETQAGAGTLPYASPEQLRGESVDARADIYALGAVLYEIATGRRPFPETHATRLLDSILHQAPKPPREVNSRISSALECVILKALEKDPEKRYQSAGELRADLDTLKLQLTSGPPPVVAIARLIRKPMFAVPVALGIVTLGLLGMWFFEHNAKIRWAREVALPEISRLADTWDNAAAFPLIREAQQVIPQDAALNKLVREMSFPISIHTTPPGASVYAKPYGNPDGEWLLIGRSPLENFPFPLGYYRLRITKEGFRTLEAAAWLPLNQFTLDPEGSIPPEMVRVPGGRFQLHNAKPVQLEDYWIDKYEVTNKQFKEFVDKGGYQNRQYWRQEIVKDGHALSWNQAMAEFRDPTGRPGPSTWELGEYPPGQDDFPVNGVSWYEAAAYAEFAKKQLPTIYHWYRATDQGIFSDILKFSNFGGSGPVRVGSRPGIGPFGTYDMAGNVKEWCWNATGSRRYILGGAWNEPPYMYSQTDARPPFDRSPANGFRCVGYLGAALPDAVTGPVESPSRDYRTEKSASDSAFRIYRSLYSYDRTELKPAIESVDESSPYWRKERITFNAAYGNERVIAWLFLPKNAAPPYQTIIFFPGGEGFFCETIDMDIKFFEFLVKTGRAVLFPIYKGMYERRGATPAGPNAMRDMTIQQYKDFKRSLDYLEIRPDIARDRLGYNGGSYGARLGSIMLAEETRIRAAVMVSGGLSPARKPPEVDEVNFAPRVKMPVLMINGRFDFGHPVETDQLPMFRLLGTPEQDKRHVLFDSGHFIALPQPLMKETLDWFDRYLGPVAR